MKNRIPLVLLAAALAAVGTAVWWTRRGATRAARPDAMPVQAEEPGNPPPAGSLAAPAVEADEPRREAAGSAALEEAPAEPLLRGRVIDTAKRPVAGVAVAFEPSGERRDELAALWALAAGSRATTDAGGVFELPFPRLFGRLVAGDERWVTLLDVTLGAEPPADEPVVVVAPRRAYAGVVVDEAGAPLPGVSVLARMDAALLRGLRPGVQRSVVEPRWSDTSDDEGAFALDDVGWSEGLRAGFEASGFERAEVALPGRSDPALRIVLRRPPAARPVAGLVVDPAGEPVADALVWAGDNVARSDRGGRFLLDLTGVPAEGAIRAVKQGYLPAELAVAELPAAALEAPGAAIGGEPPAIVLELGGAPLTITGRVVDERGNAVAGAHVWIRKGERLPRSASNPHDLVEQAMGFGDVLLSNLHRVTGDGGRFELSGLQARAYPVWAVHPATLEVIDAGPIEAGATDVLLAFTGAGLRRVAGRVVSFSDEPIPGVRLFYGRLGASGGRRFFTPLMTDLAPVTDAEGRFEFERLSVEEGAYLLPSSPESSMSDRVPLERTGDLEHVEIRLPRRCLFQLLLEQAPDEADRVRVEDGDGHVLSLMVETGNTTLATNGGLPLAGGRSEVIVTDERARTLVLTKGGQEVRRIPVRLAPGEVQVLRY